MKEIDVTNWNRNSHYEWFSAFANPCFKLSVRMDVTNLVLFCKENVLSLFATTVYCICKCANAIQPFRYRIMNKKVVEIDRANVAYTIPVGDGFINARADTSVPLLAFCETMKENKLNAAGYIQKSYNNTAIVDDIYCSCVPWIDFVSAAEPIPDNLPESNCIPRVCWGKIVDESYRKKMTLNITASHALMDGRDMSQLFLDIQNCFDNPKCLLE